MFSNFEVNSNLSYSARYTKYTSVTCEIFHNLSVVMDYEKSLQEITCSVCYHNLIGGSNMSPGTRGTPFNFFHFYAYFFRKVFPNDRLVFPPLELTLPPIKSWIHHGYLVLRRTAWNFLIHLTY